MRKYVYSYKLCIWEMKLFLRKNYLQVNIQVGDDNDDLDNDLQKLPAPKTSRRPLRSQTRPSNTIQKNLKQRSLIDFSPLFAKYKKVVSKNVLLNTRKEDKTKKI